MKSNQKMSVMFWLFKAKMDKEGLAPVYAKVTIEGEDKDISIGRKIRPEFWDTDKKLDTEGTRNAEDTNFRIREVKKDLDRHFENLCREFDKVAPQMVKNLFNGKPAKWSPAEEKRKSEIKTTLLSVAAAKISEIQLQVDKKILKKATITTWRTSVAHLADFIKFHTGSQDIIMDEIGSNFAQDFLSFLTLHKEEPMSPITAEKRIIHLKAFMEYAYDKDWIERNPVSRFSFNPVPKRVKPLEYNDVLKMYAKEMPNTRLTTVKDMFVFQCFTGFAYAELLKLTEENLVDHGEESRYLIRDRQKTEVEELVPLLPIAEQIIEKYKDHPIVIKKGHLLPVISNQKYNGYLKEVADICGINRDLKTHLARHTFGHIMLNVCYLPMEDVGMMLGHKSNKSTKRYCQVGKERVMKSMGAVREKLFDQGLLKPNLAS